MMKKKYITPAIQVFPVEIQQCLLTYSVKGYKPVEESVIIGDNDED